MSVRTLTASAAPGYNLLSPFKLRRRLNDVTICCTASDTWAVVGPPSYAGQLPVVLGSVSGEGYGSSSLGCVPFATFVTLNCCTQYNDIASMFREYQFRDVTIEVQFMSGAGFNPGLYCPVPELTLYTDPVDMTPPTGVADADAFADTTRTMLSVEKTVRRKIVPRPAIMMYDSLTGTGYAYPAKNSEMWLVTSDVTTPHYCFKGLLRNFTGNFPSGVYVRISIVADILLRRPR
jgi:hypothetical protein